MSANTRFLNFVCSSANGMSTACAWLCGKLRHVQETLIHFGFASLSLVQTSAHSKCQKSCDKNSSKAKATEGA
eukprot:6196095-Pleurochrysis_carterae.AAC.1